MKISICPTIALLYSTISFAAGAAENESLIRFPLDGFNEIVFDQEYPHASQSGYSITYGSPLDSFPKNRVSSFAPESLGANQRAILAATGSLGAELGESLLNRYTGRSAFNRDHSSILEVFYAPSRIPLQLYSGYRYIDSYSDRFDRIWGHESFRNNANGLAQEIGGQYQFAYGKAQGSGSAYRYSHWGVSPLLFSPIYRTGYRTTHNSTVELGDNALDARIGVDRHRVYYDHQTSNLFWNWDIALDYRAKFSPEVEGQVGFEVASELKPRSVFKGSVRDTGVNPISWAVQGGVYRNFRPFGTIEAAVAPISQIRIEALAALDYIPRNRNYTFVDKGIDVYYRYLEYEQLRSHIAVRYENVLFFPARASVWFDYCEKPLWERVRFYPDSTVIQQDTLTESTKWSTGVKGSYNISIKRFGVMARGNLGISPETAVRRFTIPRVFALDFTYGSHRNDSLYAKVSVENRSGSTLKYKDDRQDEFIVFSAPARIGVTLSAHIPFLLPLFRDFLSMSFTVEAGPIHLSGEQLKNPGLKNQRVIYYPVGNEIGPSLSFRMDALLK